MTDSIAAESGQVELNAGLAPTPALGCSYQGHEFGARDYPDSVCIEGFLWDADSGDEPGMLDHGGDIPCPECNADEHRAYYADDSGDNVKLTGSPASGESELNAGLC